MTPFEETDTAINKSAVIFGALADPTRLKLLRLLMQQREPNALCVNALACCLGVTQSAVSQHLKLLKSVGMVRGERRGYRVHYFVNSEALSETQQQILNALSIPNTEDRKTHQGNQSDVD